MGQGSTQCTKKVYLCDEHRTMGQGSTHSNKDSFDMVRFNSMGPVTTTGCRQTVQLSFHDVHGDVCAYARPSMRVIMTPTTFEVNSTLHTHSATCTMHVSNGPAAICTTC